MPHEARLFDELTDIHSPIMCLDEVCPIHNPTWHDQRWWPIGWDNDSKTLIRGCEHGFTHPDPDQYPFWEANGWHGRGAHFCDGCCEAKEEVGE